VAADRENSEMNARRVVLLSCLALACERASGATSGSAARKENVALNGAGATFPYPLYSKWIAEYNRLHPNVRINYQSIGSGGGIRQVVAETVDFGASDSPMKPEEGQGARGKLLHLPTAVGSIVISYNLERVGRPLRLTPELLSGIFLGEIRRWNHPELTAENPDVVLPDREITVVFRTDGSGTTAALTEYLSEVSRPFRERVGVGKSVKWPIGLGAKGNEGVTGQIKTMPGSIGYTELAYARQNRLPTAEIRNRAGNYVGPALEAATAAAESVDMPADLHVSLSGASGEAAYPLATYTYLLIYEDTKDPIKGEALANFLWWAIHDGQRYARALDYAPLPVSVVKKAEARLLTLSAGGKKLLDGV
jgi:phosphate transport system substrate-binding protein